ncbi:hypothetical protein HKB32_05345, partial [Vibrio parahaemolyticus]|nr:hypothetical protein [Vibrio parahaemolyticus]
GWSGVKDELPKANVTLDWFHIVQLLHWLLMTLEKQ